MHPGRGDDVIDRFRNGEIADLEMVIRTSASAADLERRVGVGNLLKTGADLVYSAAIGAGIEVAGGASLFAIAAGIHVPEQGLAESNSRAFVAYVQVQIGNCWNGNRAWCVELATNMLVNLRGLS